MKKITPILFCMLPLFALAFVVSGRAEEAKAPSKEMLRKYDTNNDGVISDDEKRRVKLPPMRPVRHDGPRNSKNKTRTRTEKSTRTNGLKL